MKPNKEKHFGIARKIVSNMTSESWQNIPHVTLTYEADISVLLEKLKKINSEQKQKITLNTVIVKIICEGLKAAPAMNSHLEFNRKLVRGVLKYYDNIDISMPMLLPSGEMMTVNMHDMGNKSLMQITDTVNDTVRRIKNTDMNEVMFEVSMDNTIQGLKQGKMLQALRRIYGAKTGKHKVHTLKGAEKKKYYSISETDRLTKHDIEQGTTTISNFGSVYREHNGICTLLEIVPPQTTAFAVNAAQKRPVAVKNKDGEDEVAIKMILPITIAFDHRALDYSDIVPFMRKLDEIFGNIDIIESWVQ
jgi:pyruvate dehydrogenase E2 component (dihydrolipoamide acetyltransferase)